MTTLVALQPQPFPRLHLLNRIAQADIVVYMNEVQFTAKNAADGGFSGQKHIWFGPEGQARPLRTRAHSSRLPLMEVQLSDDGSWRDELVADFASTYAAAPRVEEAVRTMRWALAADSLAEVSGASTAWATATINQTQKIHFGSHLDIDPRTVRGDRILAYCQKLGADTYLCGEPSLEYLDVALFASVGVKVVTQAWTPAPYLQPWPWRPNLSYLDAVACGIYLQEATK